MIPDAEDVDIVNQVIYDELCLGKISSDSRKEFVRIIAGLQDEGAEGVILGCTEIGLLIGKEDSSLPVYDTAQIHARVAALKSLE